MIAISQFATTLRDNRRMTIIIALLTLLVVIVTFPMRMALAMGPFERGPLQAFSASGTVWSGKLSQVNVGPASLGDMQAGLRFWPLFLGRQSFAVERMGDGAAKGHATVSSTPGGYAIEDMTVALPLDGLLAPLPAGQLGFEQVDVRFLDGKCLSASGRLTLSLRPFLPGLQDDEAMVGAPRCSDDRLLLPLANGAGTRRVDIYIGASGDYRATLRLEALPDIEPALIEGRGFRQNDGRWQMQLDGQL